MKKSSLRLFVLSAFMFFCLGQQLYAVTKLYVANLATDTTEDEVERLFSNYGRVMAIDMFKYLDTHIFRGICFVVMNDLDALKAARALNWTDFKGRPLKVIDANQCELK